MSYSSYTELGFQINNLRFAVRIPSVKMRRPKFWRKKMTVHSVGSSSSSASSSTSSSSSSDDWIAQFHARYNPVHPTTTNTTMLSNNPSPCLTSTPVTLNILPLNREKRRTVLHDVSGVKIYEDMEEVGDASEDTSSDTDDSYEIVSVENNKVIARATFGTWKSCGTSRSKIV